MTGDFDAIYTSASGLYYGSEPSPHLVACREQLRECGPRALDAGCGEGRDAVYLKLLGLIVTGVDVAEAGLAKATVAGITTFVADIRELPFTASSFEIVN